MELVRKSRKQPQPKVWMRQLISLLELDLRIRYDTTSERWVPAIQNSTNAATRVEISPAAGSRGVGTAPPVWAVDAANYLVEQLLNDPHNQTAELKQLNALFLQRGSSLISEGVTNLSKWRKAVIAAMRRDTRIVVSRQKKIFSKRDCATPSSIPPSTTYLSRALPTSSHLQDPWMPSSRASRSATIVQTHNALEDAPIYNDYLFEQSDKSDDSKEKRFVSIDDGMLRQEDRKDDLDEESSLPTASLNYRWRQRFFNPRVPNSSSRQGLSLGDEETSKQFRESGLLGLSRICLTDEKADDVEECCRSVYLNTYEPFCVCTVGVQGAGKSHTMGVILENCLLPCKQPTGSPIVRLQSPMTALVLHFDQNVTSICEATGLIEPDRVIERMSAASPNSSVANSYTLPRDRLIVLVSPSYYLQRKKFYGDRCLVKPLLFRWATLSADHIKKIMRIKENDSQLYVASMLELLRKYQREAQVPEFQGFLNEVRDTCKIPGQAQPLLQRAALLEALVSESNTNLALRSAGSDILQAIGPGTLVVADLTDPLLASDEANGIFQVLVEQFRSAPAPGGYGKLLALDEAHKFMDGSSSDGLSNAIVNAARLMRHDGLRVAVSTQSPKALAPELLELVSVAFLHRFHSQDWFKYLSAKIPLNESVFKKVMDLSPGQAMVFAARHRVDFRSNTTDIDGLEKKDLLFRIDIRPRLTADRGVSRTNVL